jgi:pimeloyl-ACP methyl ester carboxylesterase
LRPQFRCYVPDLPGAGATPWSPRITEAMQGQAALLREFVDRLQIDKLAIVGHDSGGGLARLVAAELPGRVTSLVLQNTEVPNHIPPMVRLLKLAAASSTFTTLLGRLVKSKQFRTSALGFGNCFGNRAVIEGEFYEACIRPLENNFAGQAASLAHLELGWTRVLPEIHAKIDAPIHLFWGEKDKDFFPLDLARAMAQQFRKRGEFQVIPGAKLYVHEEAHEELSRFALPLIAAGFANRAQSFDGQRQHSTS